MRVQEGYMAPFFAFRGRLADPVAGSGGVDSLMGVSNVCNCTGEEAAWVMSIGPTGNSLITNQYDMRSMTEMDLQLIVCNKREWHNGLDGGWRLYHRRGQGGQRKYWLIGICLPK